MYIYGDDGPTVRGLISSDEELMVWLEREYIIERTNEWDCVRTSTLELTNH